MKSHGTCLSMTSLFHLAKYHISCRGGVIIRDVIPFGKPVMDYGEPINHLEFQV